MEAKHISVINTVKEQITKSIIWELSGPFNNK